MSAENVDLEEPRDEKHIVIQYIEYNHDRIMLGDSWGDPTFGGAPTSGMPYRSETFFYPYNKDIPDLTRQVSQGLINPDGDSHYWGSYAQGSKQPMDRRTESCEERFTYLTVLSASDHLYRITIDLESE